MLGSPENLLVPPKRDFLLRFNFQFSEKWNARITDLRKQVEELFERKYCLLYTSDAADELITV